MLLQLLLDSSFMHSLPDWLAGRNSPPRGITNRTHTRLTSQYEARIITSRTYAHKRWTRTTNSLYRNRSHVHGSTQVNVRGSRTHVQQHDTEQNAETLQEHVTLMYVKPVHVKRIGAPCPAFVCICPARDIACFVLTDQTCVRPVRDAMRRRVSTS